MKRIGYSKGLVWTSVDSHLLQIKAKARKGSGNLRVLGTVGKDFLDSLEPIFNCLERLLRSTVDINSIDLDLYIPGQVEGKSMGAAILIALYSSLIKQPINQDLVFIGEVSANGAIEPVSESVSKLRAAYRAKLEGAVFPTLNMEDLNPILHADILDRLHIYPVSNVMQIIAISTK